MSEQLAALRATSPNILFLIARSKNANIVVYEAQMKGGALDVSEPVIVYWLDIDPEYQRKARASGKQDDRVELGTIEKRMAYGLSASPIAGRAGEYSVKLVAFPERSVRVFVADGKPRARMVIQGHECDLTRIFVQARENFFGLPTVEHVDVTGIDNAGNAVTERITPK